MNRKKLFRLLEYKSELSLVKQLIYIGKDLKID